MGLGRCQFLLQLGVQVSGFLLVLFGIGNGFVVIVCRACPDPPCARVCPTDALVMREGGGVRLKHELCIGCGNCVEACPQGAIRVIIDQSDYITSAIDRLSKAVDVH